MVGGVGGGVKRHAKSGDEGKGGRGGRAGERERGEKKGGCRWGWVGGGVLKGTEMTDQPFRSRPMPRHVN